jgi:hypothetical protein
MGNEETTIIKSASELSVLIGCEESQAVCIAFRNRGFNAFSCDLLETSGNHPEWHLQIDVRDAIKLRKWHLIILHCPCTHTAVCGNRHYWNSPLRIEGINFTKEVYELALSVCDNVVLEQPKTIMQRYIGRKSQVIQPWQFGHMETKETWLWINGLPNLVGTNNVKIAMELLPDSEKHKIWYASPSDDRGKLRSKTYPGIAQAIAKQYGDYLINNS